uniref:Large subunit GTPase 1 homolog n=1 Tax=Monodelphis domestica TaxID=13616 RepID=H9H7H8_MONDO
MGRKRAPGSGGGGGGLGRSLIKERNLQNRSQRRRDTWLHTRDMDDELWARAAPRSVTEPTALEDFLATAQLAGTEFVAEKLNVHFVPPEARTGLLSLEEKQRLRERQEEHRGALQVPRRPRWDQSTSAEKLQQMEREKFLEWRRGLVRLEEEQSLILTPFERNLDFWRQLWRVIERSDVVVQIVDARNPLLFRCEDLERYVKEIDRDKENVILINKADLLTAGQRAAWATFFEREEVRVIFWSALAEGDRLRAGSEVARPAGHSGMGSRGRHCRDDYNWLSEEGDSEYEDCLEEEDNWQTCSEEEDGGGHEEEFLSPSGPGKEAGDGPVRNDSHLVGRQELLDLFRAMHSGKKVKAGQLTVGLVGYPNVGKSSTINTIFGNKKVSVSATPGHTKHFQLSRVHSLSLRGEGLLRAQLLPLRPHVCQNIPRHVLEATYGIRLIRPREDEDPDRQPTSEELLTAYGSMRGFMTAHGQPDQPRAARYILKDYVKGKLLFCHPPPGIEPGNFQEQHECPRQSRGRPQAAAEARWPERGHPKARQIENVVDRAFFHQENVRALTRGVQAVMGHRPGGAPGPSASPHGGSGKPWKKHGNRNKKEKVRRLTGHLDA